MAETARDENYRTVREYIESVYAESLREPRGGLRHRFIDPGAGYRDLCWDWDAHFCAAGLAAWAPAVGPYVQGCLLNFLDAMRPDGSVPYCLNARKGRIESPQARPADSPANSIKPLLGLMDVTPRFFVLAISQNSVRLVSATAERAEQVDLGQTPTSLEEAMAYDDPEKHLEFHTRTSVRDPLGARSAEFHGQGVGKDDALTKKNVVEFCRMVHHGVAGKLARADEPLILAGTEPTVGLYRQVNKYDNLLDDQIAGNPDRKDLETLRQEGLEIIQPLAEQRQAEILSHYEHLAGHGKTVADSSRVLQAAGNGQVEMLLVPRDAHLWGRYDAESGAAEIHENRRDDDEDLLDLAAAETCRHGGSVYAVDAEKLPADSKLAATLRFTTS